VRGKITTGNTTGGTCTIMALGTPRYGPASGADNATVVEVKP
jgi:mannose/fructose/N-acetylgalactosamine-specific phosphotransferase system component IIC